MKNDSNSSHQIKFIIYYLKVVYAPASERLRIEIEKEVASVASVFVARVAAGIERRFQNDQCSPKIERTAYPAQVLVPMSE